jgi:hypothetical protein
VAFWVCGSPTTAATRLLNSHCSQHFPLETKLFFNGQPRTETNNMGFEIERRDLNMEIGRKSHSQKDPAHQPARYSTVMMTTSQKLPSILYYRLKQIDYNGEFEYSNEVEVLLGEIPENYSIQQNYPNPFTPRKSPKGMPSARLICVYLPKGCLRHAVLFKNPSVEIRVESVASVELSNNCHIDWHNIL